MIALELANARHGLAISTVFALGVKVDWTPDELARMAALAARPPRSFVTHGDALAQHARVAGLIDADPRCLDRGTRQDQSGWRLALDPAAFAVEAPAMADLVATAPCPVHLARGERDDMVSDDALRSFDPAAATIASAGHNAMVEQPAGVWDWVTGQSVQP